ncbi:thyrotroph embryonic factor-like [Pomacea canaliculata]|nr:thyrotroph embryonic factor-like [Pomacea canaliculata]
MASARQSLPGITLKSLLENPELQISPLANEGKHVKEKEADKELPEIDFSSAFLGPHLWEKTYDASDFDLEYMDLDEFLGENSIPLEDSTLGQKKCSSAIPSQHSSVHYYPKENIASDVQDLQKTPAHSCPSLLSPSTSFGIVAKESLSVAGATGSLSPGTSSGSTPPSSPLPVKIQFHCTEQDIALSSVPGQKEFDPRHSNFTDEELKPQPMIKKSKKMFVPDDMKDEKYWARRKKNNNAAKRSRDARRVKENQIALRASYLERENKCLRKEMEKIHHENAKLRERLRKYEPELLKNLP